MSESYVSVEQQGGTSEKFTLPIDWREPCVENPYQDMPVDGWHLLDALILELNEEAGAVFSKAEGTWYTFSIHHDGRMD